MNRPAAALSRRELILRGPIGPTLARLSIPTILGALIQVTISVVEGVVIGGLGTEALAGAALIFPVFMLTTMLSAGAIGGAVSGAMARASGADDSEQVARVVRAALVIAVGGAAVMGGGLMLVDAHLFRLLGGRGPALDAALSYGAVFFPGMLAVWMFNMIAGLMRGTGDMIRPMVGIGVVTALHAAICWPLVAAFGMAGAAMAVVAAYGVGALGLLGIVASGRAGFGLSGLAGVPWGVIGRCLSAGLLAGTQSVLTVATSLLMAGLIGRLGTAELAGYGVAARLELLMVPLIFGVGAALIALVGGNAGAGQRARAIRIGWIGACAAGGLVGALGLLVAVVPVLWIPLFSADPAVQQVARIALAVIGPCYGFFGLGLALYFASQGLDTLFWPVFGAVIRLAVIGGGAAVLFAVDLATVEALVAVVAAGMVSYGLFNAAALRLGPWRH